MKMTLMCFDNRIGVGLKVGLGAGMGESPPVKHITVWSLVNH